MIATFPKLKNPEDAEEFVRKNIEDGAECVVAILSSNYEKKC